MGTVAGIPGANNFWSLTGNAGTDPATNFLGTTDEQPLKFRVDNTPSGEINMQLNTYLGINSYADNQLGNTIMGALNMNTANASLNNSVLGTYNLVSISDGSHNIAIGRSNMQALTSGHRNIVVGHEALSAISGSTDNIAIGQSAMDALEEGNYNAAFGAQSMAGRVGGSYNLALGANSDSRPSSSGDGNVMIGHNANTVLAPAPQSGQINISNVIYGIGGYLLPSVGASNLKRVGINLNNIPSGTATTIPTETFDVAGTMRVRTLPVHAATDAINTKTDGTADAENTAPNQTFTATRTVVADANGVLGTVAGIPGSNNFWSLTGNAGTTAGTNFLGTTDDQDLMFKRNNVQAGRLGTSNTTYGVDAGKSLTGTDNVAIGVNALTASTDGVNSIAIGKDALKVATRSIDNIAIGVNALGSHNGTTLTQSYNIAIGRNALAKNTTGGKNISLGSASLGSNTTGSSNIALGMNSLNANTTSSKNISIGDNSSNKNTGNNNTVIGTDAFVTTTAGGSNVVMGYMAANGADATNPVTNFGNDNTVIGTQAMQRGSGAGNTAIGSGASGNTTGDYNIAIGYNAMNTASAGNKNIVIATFESANTFTGFANSANNNIIIGSDQNLPVNTGGTAGSNQLNIGGAIFGTGMSGNVTTPAGKIGVLTTAPTSTFHVNGSFSGNIRENVSGQLQDNDYTVVATGNVTLPAASSANKGRVYNIVNGGGASFTYDGTNYFASNTGVYSITVQSTGTRWVILSTFNL